MKVKYLQHVKQDRYALAEDQDSGKLCISIPVHNGMAEYNEYYEISQDEYVEFTANFEKAKKFVEDCKKRKEDKRLMQKPGNVRGS